MYPYKRKTLHLQRGQCSLGSVIKTRPAKRTSLPRPPPYDLQTRMPFSSNWKLSSFLNPCILFTSKVFLVSSTTQTHPDILFLKAMFSCLSLSGYHALLCSIAGCMSSSDIRFDSIYPYRTVVLSSRNDKKFYRLADRYLLLQQSESCCDNSLLRPSASKPM